MKDVEEREVRGGEDRFFTLALDMLCVASFDGFFIKVNPAFEETLGYSTEEMLSRPFMEFVHPEDRDATLAELANLTEGGKTTRFENRYEKKDGTYAWLAWRAVPVVEERLAYATARDVTERKEAEDALRLRERAIETSTNSILITDPNLPDNPIVYVNPAFEATTGYPMEYALGKNCRFLQRDDTKQPALDTLREHLKEERPCKVVLRNYKKDGTLFWNELNVYSVRDERGRLTNYVGVQVDITERIRSEEELYLRDQAVAASTNGIVITDPNQPDDPIIYVNPAFAKMTGYSREDVVGKNCRFLQRDDTEQPALEILRKSLREGRPCKVVLRNYKKDGTLFWNELNVSPVHDSGGRLVNFIGVQNDVTARLGAEEALKKSGERIRLAVEAAELGTWDFDPVGGSLSWDERTRRMFGVPLDAEIDYETFINAVHPDDVEKTDRAVAEALDPEGDGAYDIEYRTVSGVWIHATGQTLFEGTPRRAKRFIGTVLDITARRASEDRTRFLANLAQILQPLTDPDEVMEITARMLGEHLGADRCAYAEIEADENTFTITGDYTNGVPSIVGEFTLSQFGNEALRLLRNNERYVIEDSETEPRISEKDREAYRLTGIRAMVCVPLHKGGRLAGGMAVHQRVPRSWTSEEIGTVTTVVERCWESVERARSVRSLRESEERYRTLAAASTSVVWTIDPEEGFIEPQKEWEEYTGQAWEEHRGFGWKEAVHPDDRERLLATWSEAVASKRLYSSDGRLWHAPSGAHRHFIARALPLVGEDGGVREWIGMIADVEDLRRAEAEIRRLNEGLEERVRERTAKLAEAVEELESFSYSVSHDLRAPIRHIGGFARMLDERSARDLDETGRRYLDTIIRANLRAGRLVDDLLAFSRMGRADMEKSPVNMSALVRETIEELEPDVRGRNVEWIVGGLPEVWGDREMLRTVVRNLLANAVKYTAPRERAKIEVGCNEESAEYVFFVRDNGVGFDMAYVTKLFGVFQRLHASEEFEGTGIGLASVKRVASRHGGRAWAEGELDAGAAFYFTLPKEGEDRGEGG